MNLANLHICTCSTEPSLCHTAISTNIKYVGLFDLFLTLNQSKPVMFKVQIDNNYTDRHAGCHIKIRINNII